MLSNRAEREEKLNKNLSRPEIRHDGSRIADAKLDVCVRLYCRTLEHRLAFYECRTHGVVWVFVDLGKPASYVQHKCIKSMQFTSISGECESWATFLCISKCFMQRIIRFLDWLVRCLIHKIQACP